MQQYFSQMLSCIFFARLNRNTMFTEWIDISLLFIKTNSIQKFDIMIYVLTVVMLSALVFSELVIQNYSLHSFHFEPLQCKVRLKIKLKKIETKDKWDCHIL